MAFISVKNDSGLMKEGEYEVYVHECGETTTRIGTPVIAFDFVVRPDVEQPYQKKHVFKSFYQDKLTGKWPDEKIGKYANALGVAAGDSYELKDLVGRNCIIVIKHWTTDDGEKKEAIFYAKESKVGDYISDGPGFSPLDESDDDGELPF